MAKNSARFYSDIWKQTSGRFPVLALRRLPVTKVAEDPTLWSDPERIGMTKPCPLLPNRH
jgi:hypothetical protein